MKPHHARKRLKKRNIRPAPLKLGSSAQRPKINSYDSQQLVASLIINPIKSLAR
jgi:hypothetical protein